MNCSSCRRNGGRETVAGARRIAAPPLIDGAPRQHRQIMPAFTAGQ
jgi:hypothetical protein